MAYWDQIFTSDFKEFKNKIIGVLKILVFPLNFSLCVKKKNRIVLPYTKNKNKLNYFIIQK